jgi:hypothetical protein
VVSGTTARAAELRDSSLSQFGPIFPSWESKHNLLWGRQPICMAHRLHEHPLFSPENLAALIEHYPTGKYMLVHVGGRGEEKEWREGDFGGLSGREVIESIAHGRMWLNLLRVHEIDRRYGDLLDSIFDEIQGHVPGYRTFNRINGILISSPAAQVYYHFDTSGQSLWQIAGRKRVYVYPASSPFLTAEELESVCLYHNEVNVRYEPWYDEYATVFEIGPGQMLTWPLNAPHRVENLEFSVSMTVEYGMRDIQRKFYVNGANCMLRERLGIQPGTGIAGPSYWAKTALYGAAKVSGLLEAKRRHRRPITFHLDPKAPGTIVEVA